MGRIHQQILEKEGITERIDHRSFKTRTEKHEIILERCELNRQIKTDNRLLHRLKAELQKIVTVTRTPIPKKAKTMELIFSNLIIYRYNQK